MLIFCSLGDNKWNAEPHFLSKKQKKNKKKKQKKKKTPICYL